MPEPGLVSRLTLVLSTCSIHDAMRDFKGLPGVVTGSRTLCQDVNHDTMCREPIVEGISVVLGRLELELSVVMWYANPV